MKQYGERPGSRGQGSGIGEERTGIGDQGPEIVNSEP